MYSVNAEIYTAKPTTKVVAPLVGERNANRFLYGSCNINGSNEIHLVEYDERNERLFCERIYEHEGEIVDICPCPYDPSLVIITTKDENHRAKASLYTISDLPQTVSTEDKDDSPEDSKDFAPSESTTPLNAPSEPAPETEDKSQEPAPEEAQPAEPADQTEGQPESAAPSEPAENTEDASIVVEENDPVDAQENIDTDKALPADKEEMAEDPEEINPQLIYICTIPLEDIMVVQWHPEVLEKGTYPHQFVCVAPGTLTLYSVGEDHHLDVVHSSSIAFPVQCMSWDPLHVQYLAFGSESNIVLYNIQTHLVESILLNAHAGKILSICHNSNMPWILATGGEDSYIQINYLAPNNKSEHKKTLLGHTHWITSLHFNPIYDQFLLSSSTDCSLCLWKLFSISSAIYKETPEQEDGLLINLEGIGSSVYTSAWSCKLPWLFCGAGIDGKLYFGHIPKDEVNLSLI